MVGQVRDVNESTRRRHFELATGMVKPRAPLRVWPLLCALLGVAAGVAAFVGTQAVAKPLMDPAVEACTAAVAR